MDFRAQRHSSWIFTATQDWAISHFIVKETETQRYRAICPKSHRYGVVKPQVGRQPLPPGPTPPALLGPESSPLPKKQACFSLFLTDHKDSVLSSEIFGKFYLNVLCSLLTDTKKRKKKIFFFFFFGLSKQECPFREEWARVLRAEKCLPVPAALPGPGSPGVGWPVPAHLPGVPGSPGMSEQTPILGRRIGSPRQGGT